MINKIELAQYLKVTTRTIDRMVENGMPCYKTSTQGGTGAVRFDLEEVKQWMRNNTKK